MTGCIVVQCACGSREEAARIAEALVDARLAACVQLSAIESICRWQGEVAREAETMLHAKTTAACFGEAAALIRRLHGYDLPEIVALPIVDGSADYLAWIAASVVRDPDAEA